MGEIYIVENYDPDDDGDHDYLELMKGLRRRLNHGREVAQDEPPVIDRRFKAIETIVVNSEYL